MWAGGRGPRFYRHFTFFSRHREATEPGVVPLTAGRPRSIEEAHGCAHPAPDLAVPRRRAPGAPPRSPWAERHDRRWAAAPLRHHDEGGEPHRIDGEAGALGQERDV